MRVNDRKLLSGAVLTEEDKFYAECNVAGINLVDRVNGKPVRVYPYWIDRPNCNWHSPPVAGDEDENEVDEDEDESEDKSEDEERGNRKGWISRLTTWWKRRDAININFSEES
jgi:transcription elongation factor Elf1